MSGISERIEAKLDQLLAIAAGGAALSQGQPQYIQQPQPIQQFAQQPQPGGQSGGYAPATQEMIVNLVTPLVENPTIKAALQGQMQAMGINALPEARPDQYPELYFRFQQVQAQFGGGQQVQQQPQPASII